MFSKFQDLLGIKMLQDSGCTLVISIVDDLSIMHHQSRKFTLIYGSHLDGSLPPDVTTEDYKPCCNGLRVLYPACEAENVPVKSLPTLYMRGTTVNCGCCLLCDLAVTGRATSNFVYFCLNILYYCNIYYF